MKSHFLFLVCWVVLSAAANAKTFYVFVDGGASAEANYYRYYNEVRRGYETAKARGDEAIVLANDGQWRIAEVGVVTGKTLGFSLTSEGRANPVPQVTGEMPVYPPVAGKAQSSADLKAALQSLKVTNQDKVVVFMTGHGRPPEKYDPATATYSFFNNDQKWTELESALDVLPKDIKVKIATTVCYGGGVHSLSRLRKNMCSVASAPHFSESYSGSFEESLFSEAFWQTLQNSKNPTFGSLSVQALKEDIANANLGNLSSFDYVDFILKRGIYGRVYKQNGSGSKPKNGKPVKILKSPVGPEFNSSFPLSPINDEALPFPVSIDSTACESCCEKAYNNEMKRLETLSRTLNEISQAAYFDQKKETANTQIPVVRTIFHQVIEDMKQNGPRYEASLKKYQKKFNELKQRYEPGFVGKILGQDSPHKAEALKEFEAMKKEAQIELKKFNFNRQMLDRLAGLEEFNKKATPEQKKKFIDLLQCEWEPL